MTDLDRAIAAEDEWDKRSLSTVRSILGGGLAMAFAIALIQNMPAMAQIKDVTHVDVALRQLRRSATFGFDPKFAVEASIAVLAVVATLAVAVVAGSLQAESRSAEVEALGWGATRVFVQTTKIAAEVNVALAVLVLPDLGLFAVNSVLAYVAMLVSSASQERGSARRKALRAAYLERHLRSLKARRDDLNDARKWLGRTSHKGSLALGYYAIVWLTLFVAAALFATFGSSHYQGEDKKGFLILTAATAGTGALVATIEGSLLGLAVRARWSRHDPVTTGLAATATVALLVVTAVVVTPPLRDPRAPLLIVLLWLGFVPVWLLFFLGRHGWGPGRRFWTSASLELDRLEQTTRSDLLAAWSLRDNARVYERLEALEIAEEAAKVRVMAEARVTAKSAPGPDEISSGIARRVDLGPVALGVVVALWIWLRANRRR